MSRNTLKRNHVDHSLSVRRGEGPLMVFIDNETARPKSIGASINPSNFQFYHSMLTNHHLPFSLSDVKYLYPDFLLAIKN